MVNNPYNIERFVVKQQEWFSTALSEIRQGRKESHWMWFMFPQLRGLGQSEMSEIYGISGKKEAKAYLKDRYLAENLRTLCRELLKLPANIDQVFGYPDNLKLQSSITLFLFSAEEEEDLWLFKKVLDRFYGGAVDVQTKMLLYQGYISGC